MLIALLSIVLALLFSAAVIYFVGQMNVGLKVDSFSSALVAAVIIAVLTGIINFLVSSLLVAANIDMTGWVGVVIATIVGLVIAAVVLMMADRLLRGVRVAGFSGAITAAIAIAIVTGVAQWLAGWLAGLFS